MRPKFNSVLPAGIAFFFGASELAQTTWLPEIVIFRRVFEHIFQKWAFYVGETTLSVRASLRSSG